MDALSLVKIWLVPCKFASTSIRGGALKAVKAARISAAILRLSHRLNHRHRNLSIATEALTRTSCLITILLVSRLQLAYS